ncbi:MULTISPECIES: phosphoribosyltransferase [unclassified Cupriavidus]|uniref:phosphoribosyltransferase n=1 Tax=Cupriavidus sp. H19C3 TaxID=3241603 RepID=UPI003BF859B4
MYQDPEEAAVQMAEALAAYHGSHPLVLAIARGAVPIGEFVARALEGDFDVALVGRVGAQYNVAYAVGAIDESGMSYLPPTSAVGDAGNAYLERERSSLLRHLRERRHLYTPHRARLTATCRVVIVVDDGILTGMSMIAALRALRREAPARLVCAVPVAAPTALGAVREYADEMVCLAAPPGFRDLRQAYRERHAISDAEIAARLRASGGPAMTPRQA